MKPLWPVLAVALLTRCDVDRTRSTVLTHDAPSPIGPYSQAIMANNLLFVSGQIALTKNGEIDTSTVESECRQVMENVRSIVEHAGTSMSRVCKTTIFTTDLSNFSRINAVYGSYFKESPPARETVEVSRLPKGARIEISVIVALD